MKKYDYVIVGGGLFAGTFAYFAKKSREILPHCGKERKPWEVISTVKISRGIHVHKYGAHIFHTSNRKYGILSTPL